MVEDGFIGHAYLFRADGCPKTGACTELFLANIQAGMPDWVGVWQAVASVEGLGPSSSSMVGELETHRDKTLEANGFRNW